MFARKTCLVWSRMLGAAALYLGLFTDPARAAKFELAEEWPAVSFQDGDRSRTLFIHMSDLDVPGFDLPASSGPDADGGRGAKLRARDLYVPLYKLSVKDVHRKDDRPEGDVESLSINSLPTGYKLYVRPDKTGQHVIRRAPDFQISAGKDLLGLLSIFNLHASRPRNVLVMVRPGQPELAQADSLDDVELAAIASMDGSERAAATEECHGNPGSPGSNPCWRAAARKLLSNHAEAKAEQELSPFEQRYLKQRLSAKGYAQYQRTMDLPAGHPDKIALLGDWRESILTLDLKEHLTAAGPPETATAPVPVAATPMVAASPASSVSTAPATAAPSTAPHQLPGPAKTPPTKPAKTDKATPKPTPAPTSPLALPPTPSARPPVFIFRRVLLGCVVFFVVIFVLFRRKRGKQ